MDTALGAKCRLLVVDDEPRICQMLADYFALKGCEVRTVGTGDEGLALAGAFQPDVVLLDVLTPGLPWLETLHRFKVRQPSPRVIMISAVNHEDVVRVALEQGAECYVCKPVKLDELDHLVRGFVPPTNQQ